MRKIIFLSEARDYYTCLGCGANLDHGEKCDDPKCPESPLYKKEEPKKEPETDPNVEEGKDGQLRFKFDFTKTKEKLKKS